MMRDRQKMSRNVYLVRITSLLTDVSSEMVYPLYQVFVRMIMTSHRALLGPVLGVIEFHRAMDFAGATLGVLV